MHTSLHCVSCATFAQYSAVWYVIKNSSRRNFVLKLIFLLYRVDLGSNHGKMMGFKFSDPSTPLGGAFPSRDPFGLTLRICSLIINRFSQSWCRFRGFQWCRVNIWHFRKDRKWLSPTSGFDGCDWPRREGNYYDSGKVSHIASRFRGFQAREDE